MVLKLLLSILFVFVIYIALVDKMFHSNILNLVVKLLIILWILSNTKCMDNFDRLISDKLNYLEIKNDIFSTISVKLTLPEIIYKEKLEEFIYNETNPES